MSTSTSTSTSTGPAPTPDPATTPPTPPTGHAPAPHTPWTRVVVVGLAIAAVVTLVELAFSWPAVTAEPRDVPVAVVGPADAVQELAETLESQQPGVVDLVETADRDDAVTAVEQRDVVGALVLGPTPEVLTAPAAGSAPTQLMTGLASRLQARVTAQAVAALQQQAAQGTDLPQDGPPTVTVTEVVPLSPDDPQGTGMTAALFPLLLGGMAGGIAISLAVVGAGRRVLAVAVYAVVGGLVLTAVLQGWFGSLQGDWWTNAAAIALALAAVAAPLTGFVALLGRAGIAVGAVLMMLVANPISGATVPPEFLPWHWGALGQWFPPGASGTLLRDLSYFPAADTAAAWIALGAWTTLGVMFSLVGHFRTAGGVEPDVEAALED
ncbi:ABC transporter permease [Isoptericola jiangsuensis]|uniref:ABC transporter permease n=1 Tax=Isoptericola jiangsuensis TaxID=548579 RepID=UPI003AAFF763